MSPAFEQLLSIVASHTCATTNAASKRGAKQSIGRKDLFNEIATVLPTRKAISKASQ